MKNEVVIRKTSDKDFGLFATRDFMKGEIVVQGKKIKKVPDRTMHSFQIDKATHIQLDKKSRSINHSCDPNMGIRNNKFNAYDFIALRNIEKGEEVTWDYETTEHVSIAVEKCLCNTTSCRKSLIGFKYRSEELLDKYGIFIADYLKFLYAQQLLLAKVSANR